MNKKNFYNFNYIKKSLLIFNKRILISIIFILISIIILIIKIIYMQIINFNNYNQRSYNNCTRIVKLFPSRGIIFDRNGTILAKNIVFYKFEIFKSKNFKHDINIFKKLVNLSKEDIDKINLLNNNECKYKSIFIDKNFLESEIINFLVNKFILPNIKIKKVYIRDYPYGKFIAHSVGYVSRIDKNDLIFINNNKNINNYNVSDFIGKIGIEKKYENYLKGKIGIKEIEINNIGKKLNIRRIINEQNGNDIYISIDINLNKYISKLIKNSKASIIVTNVRTGEILSLVSNPSYDPNSFSKGISSEEYKKILLDKSFPMLNRSIQGLYPPASTLKPYISLYALHDKYINKDYLIFDNSFWRMPKLNKIYRDWKKSGRGWIKLIKAIEESSDIYFYNIAYNCGINKLFYYISNFEYGKCTGIDLLEESSGVVPNKEWKNKKLKKEWYSGDTISVGIGQGYLSSTPIQMSKALMILINNGEIKIPHLLKLIYDYNYDKCIYFKNKKKEYIKDKISLKNWNLVKDGMYKVANGRSGTARRSFKNAKYKIAAKSGTAQLYSINHSISKKRNIIVPKNLRDHKLMISYAPFNDPIFSIIVILENGGCAGINSGDISRKIFDYLILKKNKNYYS